ncbi:MAG: YfhO family protein [Solobacterium sp.]|nr:YfhO family protein [Solobacterium sp.]
MKNINDWKPLSYRIVTVLVYLLFLAALFLPYSAYLVKGIVSHSLSANEIFLYDHDWIQQGIPYYREFFRCIETGTLPWSWNELLGSSFYAAKASYVIGDPFAWLTYGLWRTLFHYLPTALFVITGIKMLIAGLGFERLLEHYTKERLAALVFGACYMMGGWAVIFMEQVYFLSFYALIPFVLLGLERILKNNHHLLFYISILLALSTNLYLSWSLCFFLVLYWFVRAGEYERRKETFWIMTVQTFISFLLAFLTVMVVVLPGILVLLKSPRLSGHLIDYTVWIKENICAILMNFFVPVIDGKNLLYHDYWYYFYQIGIYCGSLAVLCVPQIFVQEREWREKLRYGILLGVVLLLLVSPKVGLVLNLSYSLRYTYFVEIVLLLIAAKTFDQPVNKPTLFVSCVLLIGLLVILSAVAPGLEFKYLVQYPEAVMMWISIGLLIVYTVFLMFRDRWKPTFAAVLILGAFETLVYSSVTIHTKTTQRVPAEYLYQNEAVETAYKALVQDDPSFFRVNLLEGVNADRSVLPNSSMYYGIPALSGYDSVYNNAIHDFLDYLGLYPDVSWNFRINDSRLNALLNAKYTFASPATVPLVPKNAELVEKYSSDSILVYRNKDADGAAFTVKRFVPESEMKKLMEDVEGNRNKRINILQLNTVISDDLYETIGNGYQKNDQQFFEGTRNGSDLSFEIKLNEETPVEFSIPADSCWKMKVDGEDTAWQKCDGGFILAILPEGTHTVTFTYSIPGFAIGLVLSIIGLALSMIWLSRPTGHAEAPEEIPYDLIIGKPGISGTGTANPEN